MWAKSLFFSAMAAAGAITQPVDAQPRPQFAQAQSLIQIQDRGQREVRPLREVVDELRSQYGGEMVGYRLEDGARPIYVIRWRMPNGDVRDIRVSAAR